MQSFIWKTNFPISEGNSIENSENTINAYYFLLYECGTKKSKTNYLNSTFVVSRFTFSFTFHECSIHIIMTANMNNISPSLL